MHCMLLAHICSKYFLDVSTLPLAYPDYYLPLSLNRSETLSSLSTETDIVHVTNRWSLGSALFLASWAAMMGPWAYVQHLMSTPRLPFTAAYFGSIALTLYFSLGVSIFSISRCHTILLIEPHAAPKHSLDPHIIVDSISLFNMVLDKLFSDGLERLAARNYIRSSASSCVDDWMSIENNEAISDIKCILCTFPFMTRIAITSYATIV